MREVRKAYKMLSWETEGKSYLGNFGVSGSLIFKV
jgi:hypothetical protein